jgi:hypothetical protein
VRGVCSWEARLLQFVFFFASTLPVQWHHTKTGRSFPMQVGWAAFPDFACRVPVGSGLVSEIRLPSGLSGLCKRYTARFVIQLSSSSWGPARSSKPRTGRLAPGTRSQGD